MKKTRKRILVLTPRFPYPVIGGDRLRIYQVCKALSRRYSLTLLSLCESEQELTMAVPHDGVFDRVERVLLTKVQSYINAALVMPTRTPMQVAYFRSAAFAAAVERLLPEHDAVFSHLIRCAEYVKKASKLKILEMTDAISLNYGRVKKLNSGGGFKGMIYRLESNRLFEYERSIIKDFDLSVLVSETDKQFLVGREDNEKVLVCSNGVNLDNLPYSDRQSSNSVIAYIGNMTSVQNMDACLYFAKEVMPLISSHLEVTFRVVGRITESDAMRLRAYPNVEVTGAVPNVCAEVADAKLAVCPVRIGAGVQNKVLEYMSLGLPAIVSPVGLEGFSAIPEKDLLVADTPQEYLRQIRRIWNDRELAKRLATNARAYVINNHDWDAQLAPLVTHIDRLLGVEPTFVKSHHHVTPSKAEIEVNHKSGVEEFS